MASYNGKAVATTAKITFGGTEYDCKSLPSGVPESCELPNITTLSDGVQQFTESAVTEDGDITVVMGSAPAINATGALVIKLMVSVGGATATAADVTVGNCIVTNVEPTNIESGGDRVLTYSVTFKPDGSRS